MLQKLNLVHIFWMIEHYIWHAWSLWQALSIGTISWPWPLPLIHQICCPTWEHNFCEFDSYLYPGFYAKNCFSDFDCHRAYCFTNIVFILSKCLKNKLHFNDSYWNLKTFVQNMVESKETDNALCFRLSKARKREYNKQFFLPPEERKYVYLQRYFVASVPNFHFYCQS